MTQLPAVFRVRQSFDHPRVANLEQALRAQLAEIGLPGRIRAGDTVAVTAGSRGIAQYAEAIRAIVVGLKSLGARPFVVSAMGSHGGAVASGQRAVLQSLGITPENVGAEVRVSLVTKKIGQTPEGIAVYVDRTALEADHVVVCNRVKPHSTFAGEIQSGLTKMSVIGLGNFEGARACHRAIGIHGFDAVAQSVFQAICQACPIVAGVAIVENGRNQVGLIRAVRPEQFIETDRSLLRQAIEWLPRIPFRDIDLLVVDEVGKDISGEGLDPKVIGRSRSWKGRSLMRRLSHAVWGLGDVYWKHVLTAPPTDQARPIVHRVFFETISRRGEVALRQAVRGIRRSLPSQSPSGPQEAVAPGNPTATAAPRIKLIYARRLTPASHGNVMGIQRTDGCTQELLRQANWPRVYVNCLAAGSMARLRVPRAFANDREAIAASLAKLGIRRVSELRMLRIRNTWQLEVVEAAEALLGEAQARGGLEIMDQPRPLSYCSQGNLPSW